MLIFLWKDSSLCFWNFGAITIEDNLGFFNGNSKKTIKRGSGFLSHLIVFLHLNYILIIVISSARLNGITWPYMALDSCGAHALTTQENDCFSVYLLVSFYFDYFSWSCHKNKKKKKNLPTFTTRADNRNHFFLFFWRNWNCIVVDYNSGNHITTISIINEEF